MGIAIPSVERMNLRVSPGVTHGPALAGSAIPNDLAAIWIRPARVPAARGLPTTITGQRSAHDWPAERRCGAPRSQRHRGALAWLPHLTPKFCCKRGITIAA